MSEKIEQSREAYGEYVKERNQVDEIVKKIINDDQRQMKEQEVMQMEMLEMELIKKLQNTQAIQKEAYSELEKALS